MIEGREVFNGFIFILLVLEFLFLFVSGFYSQVVLFGKGVVVRNLEEEVGEPGGAGIVLVFGGGSGGAEGLVVEDFEFFVDQVSASVLPFGVDVFDVFHVDAGTVFVVEVVLFEGEHFAGELLLGIKTFLVLFPIAQVLHIFIIDVACCPFLFHNLRYHVRIVVSLR